MNDSNKRTVAAGLVLFAVLVFVAVPASAQKAYATPEKAVSAFAEAMRIGNITGLVAMFGPGARAIFDSGDVVADRNERRAFLAKYDAKHALTAGADGSRTLVVGENAQSFPVPLVKSESGWTFDTAKGRETVLSQRFRANELEATRTVRTIAAAQTEYYASDRDGDGVQEYAQSFRSTMGRRNGLYWPAAKGEGPSPLAKFVERVSAEGYTPAANSYRGYHYRLLRHQGAGAPGGMKGYIVDGQQTGGFAVIAYPVSHGVSGAMTYIVSHDGVVYQRNFGAKTRVQALNMDLYDPGEGWTRVVEQDLAPVN